MKNTSVRQLAIVLFFVGFLFSNCKKDKTTTPDPTVLTASTNIQAKIDEYKALLGADRQLKVYEETGSLPSVVKHIHENFLAGL